MTYLVGMDVLHICAIIEWQAIVSEIIIVLDASALADIGQGHEHPLEYSNVGIGEVVDVTDQVKARLVA